MISTDRKIFDPSSAVRERMREYAHALGSMRHKGSDLHVIIFSRHSQGFKPVQEGNLYIYPTNSFTKLGYVFGAYRIGKRIKDVGVVSVQDPFETGIVGTWLSRFHRARLQVQIHTDFLSPYFKTLSPLNRFRAGLSRRILHRANSIRAVSKRVANSLVDMNLSAPIHVLPIHTDLEQLWAEAGGINLKTEYPQFSKHILVTARLEKEKGIPLALETFAALNFADAGLFIAGEGSERLMLQEKAKNLGIEKKVVWMGWQEKKTALYASADVLLVTSHYEGYGLSMAEAAALGCPIVATDVGIAKELRDLGARINVIQERNAEALAQALKESLSEGRVLVGDATRGLSGFAQTKEEYLERYINLLTNS